MVWSYNVRCSTNNFWDIEPTRDKTSFQVKYSELVTSEAKWSEVYVVK